MKVLLDNHLHLNLGVDSILVVKDQRLGVGRGEALCVNELLVGSIEGRVAVNGGKVQPELLLCPRACLLEHPVGRIVTLKCEK